MDKNKLVRGVEACGWAKTNLFGASRLVDGEKQTCSGRRGLWMGKNKLVRGVEACGWGKTNLFGASRLVDVEKQTWYVRRGMWMLLHKLSLCGYACGCVSKIACAGACIRV